MIAKPLSRPLKRFLSVDHTCEIGLSVNLCVM